MNNLDIQYGLHNIFSEVDKIVNEIYKEIQNKSLNSLYEINKAIESTNVYTYFNNYNEQYDTYGIVDKIKDSIILKIEYLVEKRQWE